MMTGSKPWSAFNQVALSGPKVEASRPWLVVHDPEGDFQGRRFRGIDLQCCNENWPEGMIFWNSQTGALRIWRGGKYSSVLPGTGKRAPVKAVEL